MTEKNLNLLLNGTRNDFKILVDDIFNIIEIINEDVKKLKTEKVDKHKT